ncbi:hypothetical protein N7492_005588 [Penicillium capsulatum]|uniref:Uncharacterized protein n=1 Tax=Penicillium capsulatum TaxID=69766 RepID=A0A9W9I9U8_9EURO|nr:hypothetical protein N7492_005588 [Penicillium capsulatum]KAJ6135313.1 hypothetical protein N7512_000473 [Penicillium capsulatum]
MFGKLFLPLYKRVDGILAKYSTSASTRKLRLSVAEYYINHANILQYSQPIEDALINLFLGDHFLRLLVQSEECLCEEYEYLREHADDSEAERNELLDMLEHVSRTYRQSERQLFWYKSMIPKGPISRALDISRANPTWYLHPELIKDCVVQGGCCGRSCRCCEKREEKPGREWGMGHCTIECGCCAKTQGSNLMTIDEKIENFRAKWYALSNRSDRSYYQRIMRAFITGAELDVRAEPGKKVWQQVRG